MDVVCLTETQLLPGQKMWCMQQTKTCLISLIIQITTGFVAWQCAIVTV